MKSYKLVFCSIIIVLLTLFILGGCGSTTSPTGEDYPVGLSIEKLTNFSIKLTWMYEPADSDTLYYQIARKIGTVDWEENYMILESDVHEAIDYIPTSDSLVYAYKVRYYNEILGTVSPYSEVVAYLSEYTYPTDMVINQISQETLEISWLDHCQGEEGYILDRKVNDGEWENGYVLLAPDNTQITDNVNIFDTITYRVYAYIGTSVTDYLSKEQLATLLPPSGLSSTIPDLNKIRLTWQDNSDGEDGFIIDKMTGEQDWETDYTIVDSNITTYVDDNILPCGVLKYRIKAFKDQNSSGYSNIDTLFVNLEFIGSYATPGSALQVFLPVENYYIPEWTAFVSDGYQGLAVLDCSNPSSPSPITTYQDLWGDRTLSSFVSENFLYVATQSLANAVGGIQKVDITNMQSPVISNVTETVGIPKDVYVEGDFAYVAEGSNGVTIMYIASSIPSSVSNIPLSDARKIFVREENGTVYAYVANGLNNGLVIIDVTDPYNPVQISDLPLEGLANDIFVIDNIAYLSNGEKGLEIIDISSITAPFVIKNLTTGGFVNGVFAENNYVYISDIEKGFHVIDCSNPSSAYILGSLEMITEPLSIHIAGSYAYLTDSEGIKIIKIKP
ncbi:MAG: hypothetical protein RAO94_13050 [Candidatus Stygibacter australis]|nr:hypothetical protein [Candidatus Stygibacter australis]MDP8323269.1 hypothetical protein [Candidatus Stygibacter australis]